MYSLLEKVGLVFIAFLVLKFIKSTCTFLYYTLAPFCHLGPDLAKMGSWAVVTGATDGLGKAFAEELAKKGLNIVLISRTKSRLEAVAMEISEKYKVQTKIIVADFTEGQSVFPIIENELFGLDIGVLVNNVGISYSHPEYFLELKKSDKFVLDIVQCNIATMLCLCQIVMPGMTERKRGVIINVSSILADINCPLLSVYGASKAFVKKFSQDLALEYKNKGIIINCLIPGPVATKMSKIRKSSWMIPSPNNYVKKALRTVGIQTSTNGYLPHSLMFLGLSFMSSLSSKLSAWMTMNALGSARSRALKKHPETINS